MLLYVPEIPVSRKTHHHPKDEEQKSYDFVPENPDRLYDSGYHMLQQLFAGIFHVLVLLYFGATRTSATV